MLQREHVLVLVCAKQEQYFKSILFLPSRRYPISFLVSDIEGICAQIFFSKLEGTRENIHSTLWLLDGEEVWPL